jgi:hypothetical protein
MENSCNQINDHEKKQSILETSQSLALLILFAIVIGTGALFYYNWYDGCKNRVIELKKLERVGCSKKPEKK